MIVIFLWTSLIINSANLNAKTSPENTNKEAKIIRPNKDSKNELRNFNKMKKHFPHLKSKDIQCIDQSLKKYGNLGTQGDFSQGLAFYLLDHSIKIEDQGEKFYLQIFPKKGNWGFSATIEKATCKLENPVIETEAEPPSKPS